MGPLGRYAACLRWPQRPPPWWTESRPWWVLRVWLGSDRRQRRRIARAHARVREAVGREQVAGFARAEAKTLGGQLKQLSNLWGDLKEKLGAFVARPEQAP